jgi:hypothetical protein
VTGDEERSTAKELETWYQVRLRPRIARAVRLGLVDSRRAVMLDRDLRVLIESGTTPASGAATATDHAERSSRCTSAGARA